MSSYYRTISEIACFLTNPENCGMLQDMPLSEELKTATGRKKRYLLLRIIGMGAEASRQLCGITKGTYNTWLQNDAFVQIHRKIAGFAVEYQREALQLLRRNNQQRAVLLEEKMLIKIDEELESGNYDLLKTNLGREVYSKLMADLDYQPQVQTQTWWQRIDELNVSIPNPQIEGGEIVDGTIISETTGEQKSQHPQGDFLSEGEQGSEQTQEET